MKRRGTNDWDRPPESEDAPRGGLSGPAEDVPPAEAAWDPAADALAAQLRGGGGLPAAFLAGVLAAALGVAVWVLLTWQTGTVFAVMALGVGYLVGIAVRWAGRGARPAFGVLAAAITLAASLAGLVLSAAVIIARQEELPLEEIFERLDPALVVQVLGQVVSPITIIILLFAVYESFRMAVTAPPQRAAPKGEGEIGSFDEQDEEPRP